MQDNAPSKISVIVLSCIALLSFAAGFFGKKRYVDWYGGRDGEHLNFRVEYFITYVCTIVSCCLLVVIGYNALEGKRDPEKDSIYKSMFIISIVNFVILVIFYIGVKRAVAFLFSWFGNDSGSSLLKEEPKPKEPKEN
jgi:amino acid permease